MNSIDWNVVSLYMLHCHQNRGEISVVLNLAPSQELYQRSWKWWKAKPRDIRVEQITGATHTPPIRIGPCLPGEKHAF